MLEVRLRSGTVVAFDGRVLEIFETAAASRRFHIARLSTPRLLQDADGQGWIVLDEPDLTLRVTREDAPACERLVAAIAQARAGDDQLGH